VIQKSKRNNPPPKTNKNPFPLKIPVSHQGNHFIKLISGSDHFIARQHQTYRILNPERVI